jgi:hypothetical protein
VLAYPRYEGLSPGVYRANADPGYAAAGYVDDGSRDLDRRLERELQILL